MVGSSETGAVAERVFLIQHVSSVRPPQQPTQMLPPPLQSIAVRAQLLQRYCTVHVHGLLQLQLQLAEARMTPALPCTQTT
ncbi:hypothetical protein EYF80_002924 [Liparis tanakae]|uniref:Uncharacterized protein n=1 Tax=Liparis tanakae TaxID=230148 RepID=A0A4Z2J9Z1_9TELE|nr:hypothetical protein EYF80_002924 [Liparis tanakae]